MERKSTSKKAKTENHPGRPSIEQFGKDHWSTLAFIEHLCVDSKGVMTDKFRRNMRTNINTHPGYGYFPHGDAVIHRWQATYDTRLKDGSQIPHHDDWDCVEDMEAAGLLENIGTGMHPVYRMTVMGNRYTAAIRAHKASGGSFSTFDCARYDKVPA